MMKSEKKQLTKDERTALQRFTRGNDRGRATIFVGRKPELAAIQERLDWLMQRQADGESAPGADLTTVIQGAPGAGKSAFLEKVEETWPLNEQSQSVAVSLDPEVLTRPLPDFMEAIASKVKAVPSLVQMLRQYLRLKSIRVGGVVSLDIDPSPVSSQSLVPVILLFDEIQTELLLHSTAESRDHLTRNLRLLHTGRHGAPIFPIYGGLANSADLLRSAGLTRLASKSEWTLSGLSEDEVDELMARFVTEYLSSVELDPATLNHWQEALRRDSQGWPMHTRHFLIALSEAILAQDGRPMAVDLEMVRRQITRLRCEYYEHRMQGPLRKKYILISKVLEAMAAGGFMEEDQIIHALSKAHQVRSSDALGRGTLPDGMTAEEVFGAMLHAGIVQKHDHLYFACPIPSLASYLAVMATYPPSALLIAVLNARLDRIEQIINGCQTDEERARQLQTTDVRGRTPLILAVELGIGSVVEQLVAAEGHLPAQLRSLGMRDHVGRTARDHVTASGKERLVALLDQFSLPEESINIKSE